MARCTRSGVRANPSRSGSSPSRTSISRTRSAVLAAAGVGDSKTCGIFPFFELMMHLGSPGILEGVHHRLFHPYLFQMGKAESAAQNFIDPDAEIFRGWDELLKLGQRIQVDVFVARQDLALDKAV